MTTVRGHDIPAFKPQGSAPRRAIQFQNTIITALGKLGVHKDHVNVLIEPVAIKKTPAIVSWHMGNDFCYFSRQGASFIENLYIITHLLTLDVAAVIEEREPLKDFIAHYVEEDNIVELRKEARKTLGVTEDCADFEEIKRQYKLLAKQHHPDASGNAETFKTLSTAFKILSRELN